MNETRLTETHRLDLLTSGLDDRTIAEAAIRSVSPGEMVDRLGFTIDGVASMYEIPYCEGYSRYKVFYEAHVGDNGNPRPKYLARKNGGNRLCIPPRSRNVLHTLVPLYVTEGEKKALKATQEGLPCIAIAGLWNWKSGEREGLIADFDAIAVSGRSVFIVPDNDWLKPDRHGEPKNLRQAVYELAYHLIDRGARVHWVELPEADSKIGLDDYLCEHAIEDFKGLPTHEIRRLTVEEEIKALNPGEADRYLITSLVKRIADIKSNTEQELLLAMLSDKLGISKAKIRNDLRSCKTQEELSEPVLSLSFPGLIDVALGDDGTLVYVVKNGQSLSVAGSWELDGVRYGPPAREDLPFALPRAGEILRHYCDDDDARLFADLVSYFKRFSYLPDELWQLVVSTVFLSYIQDHPQVDYLPMLLFWAVPERGKSRTGKSLTNVAFRGIHLVELRETNIFRYAQDMQATLFFDIMDLWKKAERNNAEDLLLLRFEKGARVSRVMYPEKGAFKDMVHYRVFGSTVIATNEPVHKILDTRCIPITMPNRPGIYDNPTPESALELKERLTAWRARTMGKPLPAIGAVDGLRGRLWDISRPMLQVMTMVYPEGLAMLKAALLDVAGHRTEEKRSTVEGRIAAILNELSPEGLSEWEIRTSEVTTALNDGRPEKYHLTPQYVGRKLKALGLKTRITNGHSTICVRGDQLRALAAEFDGPPPSAEENSPNSPNSLIPDISMSCGGESSDVACDSHREGAETHRGQHVETAQMRECGESGDNTRKAGIEEMDEDEVVRVWEVYE